MKNGEIDSNAKCNVMLTIEDRYVLADGLNGNIDVFSFENFDYICTIDINEETLSTAYFSSEVSD